MEYYYLFIDLETTGIPHEKIKYKEYYDPKDIKYYNTARVVEICYKIYKNTEFIKKCDKIINPKDFKINNTDFATKIHKITQEIAETKGIDINLVLKELETDLNEYKINYIIAHNYKFDKNVLLSEIYRNNNNNSLYEKIENIDSICTMELGMKFYNKTKSLKLIDLYNNLFEKNMRQYHRASKDVDLCILCYFDLNVKQLIFELNNNYLEYKEKIKNNDFTNINEIILNSFNIQNKLCLYGYEGIYYCYVCNKKIDYNLLKDHFNCNI